MYAHHVNIPSMLPPGTFGNIAVFDGIDTSYCFEVYGISEIPAGTNAVYMFCRFQSSTYFLLYIGRAENLVTRLTEHERISEAILQGASHLLVCMPDYTTQINFIEAERRLIAYYNPPLNIQHRTI